MLEYHREVIATNPEAAFYARKMKAALKTGRLENPKTRKVLLREGRLCGTWLAFEACLESALDFA